LALSAAALAPDWFTFSVAINCYSSRNAFLNSSEWCHRTDGLVFHSMLHRSSTIKPRGMSYKQ
jgi:hypothetical protein